MTWAYDEICSGEDPWTALGNFTNAWYGYAKHIRPELVCEPIHMPSVETEHTRRWAAFCAASVEFLCGCYNMLCPDWVHDSHYNLAEPWWKSPRAEDPEIRAGLLKTAPPPFARRNIFCTNRLYQNKYEMAEWIMEARAKGLTGPGEAWGYARDREITIHGA